MNMIMSSTHISTSHYFLKASLISAKFPLLCSYFEERSAVMIRAANFHSLCARMMSFPQRQPLFGLRSFSATCRTQWLSAQVRETLCPRLITQKAAVWWVWPCVQLLPREKCATLEDLLIVPQMQFVFPGKWQTAACLLVLLVSFSLVAWIVKKC